jgi:hypothetical protein
MVEMMTLLKGISSLSFIHRDEFDINSRNILIGGDCLSLG